MPDGQLITETTFQSAWDDAQAPLYRSHGIHNQYDWVEGVLALPVALSQTEIDDGESPVVVVRLHAPYRVRRVTVDVQKQVTPPVLPAPMDTGNFKFLGASLSLPAPSLNSNLTTFDWAAGGEYVFVEDNRANVRDGFVLGMGPFTLQTQVQNMTTFGGGQKQAPDGAAEEGGIDVQNGYAQARTINMNLPTWMYNTPSFFPGKLFNSEILNGGPTPGTGTLPQESLVQQ